MLRWKSFRRLPWLETSFSQIQTGQTIAAVLTHEVSEANVELCALCFPVGSRVERISSWINAALATVVAKLGNEQKACLSKFGPDVISVRVDERLGCVSQQRKGVAKDPSQGRGRRASP